MGMSNRFRQVREQLGLTQAQLAARIGVTQGSVSFYESGQITPPPDVVRILIAAAKKHGFAVTYDDIYREIASGKA